MCQVYTSDISVQLLPNHVFKKVVLSHLYTIKNYVGTIEYYKVII